MLDSVNKYNIALEYSQVKSPSNPEAQCIAAEYILRSGKQVSAECESCSLAQ